MTETFPNRTQLVNKIYGVRPGTKYYNNIHQLTQERAELLIASALSHLFSYGWLKEPVITKPSVRRLSLNRSGDYTKYITSLGCWEVPNDLSIEFNELTSGVAVDRYDFLYLELFKYRNDPDDESFSNGSLQGSIGFRLNIYEGNASPTSATTPTKSTTARNPNIEKDHCIFPLRAVQRYQTETVDETDIDTGTDISVLANLDISKITAAKAYITDGTIGGTSISDLLSSVGESHSHDNKSLLDTYAQTETNLASAVTNTHTHSNKTALDDITSTDLTNYDAAYTHKTTVDAINGIIQCNGSGSYSATTSASTWNVTTGRISTLNGNMNCNNYDMTNVDINSGTIDGTTIGSTTPASGSFTTLATTGAITIPNSIAYQGKDSSGTAVNMLWMASNDTTVVGDPSYVTDIYSSGSLSFVVAGANPVDIAANGLFAIGVNPMTDNAYDIGYAEKRWDDIFATNATIQTSDVRQKENIKSLSDTENGGYPYGLDFVNRTDPISYKFKDDDTHTYSRIHIGFGAQDIEDIIVNQYGLSTNDFAGLIKAPTEDGTDYIYGLRIGEFVPISFQAIKELSVITDTLEARIDTLEVENTTLKAQMADALTRLEALEA